jgi:hypothetical protein
MHKKLIRPDRLRRPPARFSWVDHRLVREGHLRRCTSEALALYLFLIVVADAEGLSYYGEVSLCGHLGLEAPGLRAARRALVDAGLIAYERPFYQVLSLDAAVSAPPPAAEPPAAPQTVAGPRSFSEILAGMGGRS